MDRHSAHSSTFDSNSAGRAAFEELSGPSVASRRLRLVPTPRPVVTDGVTLAWTGLCTGQLRIARHVQAQDCTILYLEDRRANEAARGAIQGRALEVLQRVLAGQSLNFIALDLARSSSTVSADFKVAMVALGLEPRLSALPLYLVQLWQATHGRASAASSIRSTWDSDDCRTVRLPRPDLALPSVLSHAEFHVCTLLLHGYTHAAIASARRTSLRTVANQIASIFGKLKVSGRLELLTNLARAAGESSESSCRAVHE